MEQLDKLDKDECTDIRERVKRLVPTYQYEMVNETPRGVGQERPPQGMETLDEVEVAVTKED